MKRLIFLLGMVCLLGQSATAQGVTIGSNNPPDPSAVLDMQSSQSGVLIPRLSNQQRNGIANPAVGLQIYNTDTECFEAYFPTGWKATSCDCNQAPPAPAQINGPSQVCPGDALVLFVVPSVQGAASYQWTIDNQDTLVGNATGDSILVNFSNSPGIRNISVVAVNSCGSSNAINLSVDVSNPSAAFTYSPSSPSVNNAVQFQATQANLTYQWTFQNGTPGSSVSQTPSVTWTQAATVNVQLVVTNQNGCTDTNQQSVTISTCAPTQWQFTTCGQTGRTGPSQSQCNNTYGSGVVSVSGGIQTWTVPATGNYTIEAAGAQGGPGGRGAVVRGVFSLTAGQPIKILVGQQGGAGSGDGGGGGSFVTQSNNTPIIIAGGGGGRTNYGVSDGTTNTCGRTGDGGSPGSGGCNGNGGNGAQSTGNSGGGGLLTNGTQGTYSSTPGLAFVNGGAGGAGSNNPNVGFGGFGGGGGGNDGGHSGGGGGYSGGGGSGNGGSGSGGGGGSFIASGASNVATGNGQYANSSSFGGQPIQNLNTVNTGDGYVTITRICP